MPGREIYKSDSFINIIEDGRIIGYQFAFKAQYYRGFTLSILRDIQIVMDENQEKKEDIRIGINGEFFTLDEARTVVDPDYRWEFGDYATIRVLRDGGLKKGRHHIRSKQVIAPSYMPFQIEAECEKEFSID